MYKVFPANPVEKLFAEMMFSSTNTESRLLVVERSSSVDYHAKRFAWSGQVAFGLFKEEIELEGSYSPQHTKETQPSTVLEFGKLTLIAPASMALATSVGRTGNSTTELFKLSIDDRLLSIQLNEAFPEYYTSGLSFAAWESFSGGRSSLVIVDRSGKKVAFCDPDTGELASVVMYNDSHEVRTAVALCLLLPEVYNKILRREDHPENIFDF